MNATTNRRRWMPLVVIPALLVLLAWQDIRLRGTRRQALPLTTAYSPDAPAWLNLVSVSLGGFRGLAATMLWVRVSILQEEARFVELVTLSDWITRLDPHAEEAWSYHAWNLAYNVSAMLTRPDDRLRWVDAGIELLRDNGLRLNPGSAYIRRELGWLYQHKIGAAADSAHMTYQLALANRLAPLLENEGGAPPPDSGRAARLAADFRLDPGIMRQLQDEFGPLDWRLPESHAIYWAWDGLRQGCRREDPFLRRMIMQSLRTTLDQGLLLNQPRPDGSFATLERGANQEIIAGALPFHEHSFRLHPAAFREPFARFLSQAIRHLSAAGNDDEARDLHQRLTELLAPEPAPSIEEIIQTGQTQKAGFARR